MPPKGQRSAMPKIEEGQWQNIRSIIDKIVCDDARLTMMTDKPKKVPLQFEIHALTLTRVGANHPMHFDAQLVNPKPSGDIATERRLRSLGCGRTTEYTGDGTYSFTHADLSTTHGIAGILSSQGKYSGQLDTITVDGDDRHAGFQRRCERA